MKKMEKATAVCRIFGDGQKVTAAVIEMKEAVSRKEISAESFEVKGRRILRAFVSETEQGCEGAAEDCSDEAVSGKYVVLELDPKDQEASTRYMIGRGRDARTGIRRPVLDIRYTASGESIETAEAADELADQFRLLRYQRPGSGQYLDYQLFVPEHLKAGKKYPLVLFMHDMGACSDDRIVSLCDRKMSSASGAERSVCRPLCFLLQSRGSKLTGIS